MTLLKATANERPATPVNSAIWITGQFACSAIPSPFQPNPPNNQPRIHSCVTQAQARQKATRKLVVDLSHDVVGAAAGALPARATISFHLLATGCAIVSRGRSNPTNHAQNATCIPR